ncbi:hypothetical protein ACFS5J_01100 [Flavobacterium chuncheonense]|uniref:Uncharacterized protein n=1 Tax=Flavobacterium chuncheonense TaxID=2026653 RepID=A0ABW5YHY9_9FLAO
MFKVITFSSFLLFSLFGFSQNEVILDVIAKETCSCISERNINLENEDENQLTMELGLCMIQSYKNHIDEFSLAERLDMSNSTQMRAFGEKIGLKMVNHCPDFVLALGRKKLNETDVEDADYEDEYAAIEGKVKSISFSNNLVLKIVEPSGKVNEFIVLNDFDNSFLLTDKVLKNNDIVKVSYYEIALYDVKLNKFIVQKIISDLNKI